MLTLHTKPKPVLLEEGAVKVRPVEVPLSVPLVVPNAVLASPLLALQSQVMPRSAVVVVSVSTFPVVLASTPLPGELIPVAVVSASVGASAMATTVAEALAEVPGVLSWL